MSRMACLCAPYLVASAAHAAPSAECSPQQAVIGGPIGARIDDVLRAAVPFGFSGQVLVAKGGRIVLAQAYGMAQREARRPMQLDTRVGIASLSKMFTAAAILRSQEQGRLRIEDPVGKYLPQLPRPIAGLTLSC